MCSWLVYVLCIVCCTICVMCLFDDAGTSSGKHVTLFVQHSSEPGRLECIFLGCPLSFSKNLRKSLTREESDKNSRALCLSPGPRKSVTRKPESE